MNEFPVDKTTPGGGSTCRDDEEASVELQHEQEANIAETIERDESEGKTGSNSQPNSARSRDHVGLFNTDESERMEQEENSDDHSTSAESQNKQEANNAVSLEPEELVESEEHEQERVVDDRPASVRSPEKQETDSVTEFERDSREVQQEQKEPQEQEVQEEQQVQEGPQKQQEQAVREERAERENLKERDEQKNHEEQEMHAENVEQNEDPDDDPALDILQHEQLEHTVRVESDDLGGQEEKEEDKEEKEEDKEEEKEVGSFDPLASAGSKDQHEINNAVALKRDDPTNDGKVEDEGALDVPASVNFDEHEIETDVDITPAEEEYDVTPMSDDRPFSIGSNAQEVGLDQENKLQAYDQPAMGKSKDEQKADGAVVRKRHIYQQEHAQEDRPVSGSSHDEHTISDDRPATIHSKDDREADNFALGRDEFAYKFQQRGAANSISNYSIENTSMPKLPTEVANHHDSNPATSNDRDASNWSGDSQDVCTHNKTTTPSVGVVVDDNMQWARSNSTYSSKEMAATIAAIEPPDLSRIMDKGVRSEQVAEAIRAYKPGIKYAFDFYAGSKHVPVCGRRSTFEDISLSWSMLHFAEFSALCHDLGISGFKWMSRKMLLAIFKQSASLHRGRGVLTVDDLACALARCANILLSQHPFKDRYDTPEKRTHALLHRMHLGARERARLKYMMHGFGSFRAGDGIFQGHDNLAWTGNLHPAAVFGTNTQQQSLSSPRTLLMFNTDANRPPSCREPCRPVAAAVNRPTRPRPRSKTNYRRPWVEAVGSSSFEIMRNIWMPKLSNGETQNSRLPPVCVGGLAADLHASPWSQVMAELADTNTRESTLAAFTDNRSGDHEPVVRNSSGLDDWGEGTMWDDIWAEYDGSGDFITAPSPLVDNACASGYADAHRTTRDTVDAYVSGREAANTPLSTTTFGSYGSAHDERSYSSGSSAVAAAVSAVGQRDRNTSNTRVGGGGHLNINGSQTFHNNDGGHQSSQSEVAVASPSSVVQLEDAVPSPRRTERRSRLGTITADGNFEPLAIASPPRKRNNRNHARPPRGQAPGRASPLANRHTVSKQIR